MTKDYHKLFRVMGAKDKKVCFIQLFHLEIKARCQVPKKDIREVGDLPHLSQFCLSLHFWSIHTFALAI